jgi:hypothetical protein
MSACEEHHINHLFASPAWVKPRARIQLPPGGTEGQALLKRSDDFYDVEWGDVATKGGAADESVIALSTQVVRLADRVTKVELTLVDGGSFSTPGGSSSGGGTLAFPLDLGELPED